MRESPHRTNHALSGVGFKNTERKEHFMLRHPKQEVRQIKARYHTLAGKLASAFMWL